MSAFLEKCETMTDILIEREKDKMRELTENPS